MFEESLNSPHSRKKYIYLVKLFIDYHKLQDFDSIIEIENSELIVWYCNYCIRIWYEKIQRFLEIVNPHAIKCKMDNLWEMSITAWSFSWYMDYSKYLQCPDCQESGLYCNKHRIEVEAGLRKRELNKVLKMSNYRSPQYVHAIKGLLKSYDVWKVV